MGGFGNNASSNVTGPDSSNNAFVNNYQNAVVNNINDKGKSDNCDRITHPLDGRGYTDGGCNPAYLGVLNDVSAYSDAGNSSADNNTGPGSVMAGWASLVQDVMTHLNDNLTQLGL